MSLPFDFSATLEAFECPEPIEVYEKTGQYVNGEWVQTEGIHRTLSCILLNVDETKLQIVANGRNVDSAYSIMYSADQEPLYIDYQQNRNIQNLQSYAIIDNFEYVVVNNPETVKNAGFRSYYALRFKEQENA